MTGAYSEAVSWFALFKTIVDLDTKLASHRKSPDKTYWSPYQQPNTSYCMRTRNIEDFSDNQVWKTLTGLFCTRHRRLKPSIKENTAISPEVEWGEPKWTPDTSRSESLSLNCENCVYFQDSNAFISHSYLTSDGNEAFQTTMSPSFDDVANIFPLWLKETWST